MFRSGLEGAPFQIASFALLLYAVMPQLADPLSTYARYLFAAAEVACFVSLIVTRPIYLSPLLPLGPLLLFVMGCISLFYSVFLAPGTSTYSSGLIPLILAAMPLLVPPNAVRVDSRMVTRYLLGFYSLAAILHVFWATVAVGLGWEELEIYYGGIQAPLLNGTISLAYLVLLAGLFRRERLLWFALVLVVLNEVLRPTSSLAFSTVFALSVIILQRLRHQQFFRRAAVLLVITICVTNLAILESESFADAVYSIEPMIKQEALDGFSNNEFRLGVLSAARYEMSQYPLLIGKAFTGDVAVDAHAYLPWLQDLDKTAIHDDFAIMVVQGGLIGYGMFISLFIGMALLCARGARLARVARDSNSETLFDALQAMNIMFMLYCSAQPSMQQTQCVLLYLVLVPLAVFLARAQPGFAASS